VPIYDYVCDACRHRFEAFHGLNEAGPHQCPACEGGPVRRAFAPPTIVFKGSGWAKLDRRYSGSPQRRKDGEKQAAEGGTSAAEGGTSAAKDAPAASPDPKGPGGPGAAASAD
jgi:putative FmdB family regulatory protein